jgi:transposase InsO family protein
MSFKSTTVMEQKLEFVHLAIHERSNISDLCQRYGITRKTGYKWITRYKMGGVDGLADLSRRPHHSPFQTSTEIENYICNIRRENQEWGSKKIYRILKDQKEEAIYKHSTIPSKSTITSILKRNGLINEEYSEKAKHYQRFEYEHPNELWQMDFKGYFSLDNKQNCHPLTILDDHSRFNIVLVACMDQQHKTVKDILINAFRRYGMPEKILSDNGSPWGCFGEHEEDGIKYYTKIDKWLMQLNIESIHGRAYHPQTQGKEERFHRTLKAELLQYEHFRNIIHCQKRFDWWRNKYNCQRPHEALNLDVPTKHYKPSNRIFPEKIKSFEYQSSDHVRKVCKLGKISFKNKDYRIGKAFSGERLVLKESKDDGKYEVYYCNHLIRIINLK